MTAAVRVLALALLALVLGPAAGAAAQQALPPSLSTDTTYAFAGTVEYDFAPGLSPDEARGAAIDSARGRHYAVGDTAIGGDVDVALLARRADGSFDPTFDGDGSLALDLAPGAEDRGIALAVLPDGRLRVLASIDSGVDLDVAVAGLLPGGAPDPAFGGGDGLVSFGIPGQDDEAPTALAIAADGRLAITGSTSSLGALDTFVAVLGADGSPTAFGTTGVAVRDAGAGSDDTGADVAWGARGPVALVETSVGPTDRHTALLAFTDAGTDDAGFGGGSGRVALDAGGTDTTAGGLLAYGGRLWATGSVTVDVDVDAYLARVDGDGGHPVARRFDMRGSVFPASQQVKSVGEDLTLVPGEPDTLVVGGSVFTDAGLEVAAAAFNLLDGELPALQMTELVIPVEGQGAAVGVAGGTGGVVALTASARDFSLETNTGSDDLSIAMARVLVDAEKRCDLSLTVLSPLELVMRGLAPSTVTLRAANSGQRACGGAVSVPAPYSLAPAELITGKLGPGQSIVLTPAIAYGAALPADDTLVFTLTAADDAAQGDNAARLHVLFSFCDLELLRVETPRMAGFEGAQRYGFTVRNAGTADCTRTGIAVGGSGRRALLTERYTVPAGQSVTDEVQVAVRRRTVRPGGRAPIAFAVATTGDVRLANNAQRAQPVVVRVADTNARRPTRRNRLFTGTAKAARRVKGVKRRTGKVVRVELAVRRKGKSCRWLAGTGGGLRVVPKGLAGTCDQPVWIPARGTEDWRLRLRGKLPKGRYTLLSRAIARSGAVEGAFSFGDRNKVRFRIQ